MKAMTIGLAALTSMMAAAPATASIDQQVDDYEAVTTRVEMGDLNLLLSKDQRRLEKRIKRAASNLCTERGATKISRIEDQLCINRMVDGSKMQVEMAIYNARRGMDGKRLASRDGPDLL